MSIDSKSTETTPKNCQHPHTNHRKIKTSKIKKHIGIKLNRRESKLEQLEKLIEELEKS
ncbi:hypothetical protein MTR_7g037775 [Medicago truncatula]|uniref:Uncharacterized protein n=1 Tax=Medicago truncatula TaxID=3880 RepID=A0A072TYM2_MEDTR|nr:hypothetical protein MTR_7g037775 [Medicago truncatula]